MRNWAANFGLALAWLMVSIPLSAAQPLVKPEELPRVPPTEPAAVLTTFRVKPGFRLDLVASEPLVADPVAMSFDEDGRLYVVEMRDYSERRDERLGQVRRLEDTDNDGVFDRSTIFAERLPWPTAVICWGGGVFVGATPDLLYLKDANGDGRADERRVVFTGFGNQTSRLNVQQLLNSFQWGLDNRIHGALGGNASTVTVVGRPEIKPLELRGRDFSFDPRTLDLRAESGGAQHGMCFDDSGRKFVCSNSDHIQLVMYEDRYLNRNPFLVAPSPRVSIAADGPAAEVFRLSPDEPWRVIRTRWRVTGLVPGLIEGGGRPSGYFTGATGTTIYRGDAWPEEFRGDAFIADCGSNLIHRKKLLADGLSLVARRPVGEENSEFIASTDNWFRPVQFANAPDGNLYVLDMYRETIEHPWSIPESIKQHLDLNSGNDLGRIYRIARENFRQPKPVRLSRASTRELVALLEHPNGWHRDTAARVLCERQDNSGVQRLVRLARGSDSPLGRLHALAVLDGLGALRAEHLKHALADPDERVRIQALKQAARAPGAGRDLLWNPLGTLVHDPSPLVRFQLAFTLGEFQRPEQSDFLLKVLEQDPASRWLRLAVLSSLQGNADQLLAKLIEPTTFASVGSLVAFSAELAEIVGARNQRAAVDEVVAALARRSDLAMAGHILPGLDTGLRRAGSALHRLDAESRLEPIYKLAAVVATDAAADEAHRRRAIAVLGTSSSPAAQKALLSLVEPKLGHGIPSAALGALFRRPDSDWAEELLHRWSGLTPRLRTELLELLLRGPDRTLALVAAVERGDIARAEISFAQVTALRSHSQATVRERAVRVFGERAAGDRQAVIDTFQPALALRGDRSQGAPIFRERCASCHRLGAEGIAVGPDLVSVGNAGAEKLLVSILDPNREVAAAFVQYSIDTADGENVSGVIANESEGNVTLRGPSGHESQILRPRIRNLKSLNTSLMPEGLEQGLSEQQMADLLEYLTITE